MTDNKVINSHLNCVSSYNARLPTKLSLEQKCSATSWYIVRVRGTLLAWIVKHARGRWRLYFMVSCARGYYPINSKESSPRWWCVKVIFLRTTALVPLHLSDTQDIFVHFSHFFASYYTYGFSRSNLHNESVDEDESYFLSSIGRIDSDISSP